MVPVGKVAPHAERLMRVTQECLYKALAIVKPGTRLGDIGQIIQEHAEGCYYSVVRALRPRYWQSISRRAQVLHWSDRAQDWLPKLE